MYKEFYHFRERPFQITPDPEYFFFSRGHKLAYDYLRYGLTNQAGITVIIGKVGTGKTTLIKQLLNEIEKKDHLATISNTGMNSVQFLQAVLQEFGLDYQTEEKISLYITLKNFLIKAYRQQEKVILIVDEAQSLSTKMLEEIRMISDLQTEKEYLIQIVLVGQPQLKEILNTKEMEQFTQRITSSCYLKELNPAEISDYIKHRLKISGSNSTSLFTEKAIQNISQYSKGIPRIINVICDDALVYGFADELPQIDYQIIEEVVKNKKEAGFFLPEYNSLPGGKENQDLKNKLHRVEEDLARMKKKLDSLILIMLKMSVKNRSS